MGLLCSFVKNKFNPTKKVKNTRNEDFQNALFSKHLVSKRGLCVPLGIA